MGKLSNWIEVISVGTVALGVGAAAFAELADPPKPHPANALILFGANWCAPCLAELRELPALAAAVAPAPVILAWQDGAPRPLWPSWPANAETSAAAEADRMAGGEGLSAGLPYAVLLDGEGKRCAIWKGRMTPERVPRFRALCGPLSSARNPGSAVRGLD